MKFILTIGLVALIAITYIGTRVEKPTETSSTFSITEDEIKEYVSMSGAIQEITVAQDTIWVLKKYAIDNSIFGQRVQLWERTETHTLKERRTWRVTAGIDGEISMRFKSDTVFIVLEEPRILHIEELHQKYSVSQSGEWSAKGIHELATKSRNLALSQAEKNEIKTEAFNTIAKFLAYKMPVQTVVNGMPVLQKSSSNFSENSITVSMCSTDSKKILP